MNEVNQRSQDKSFLDANQKLVNVTCTLSLITGLVMVLISPPETVHRDVGLLLKIGVMGFCAILAAIFLIPVYLVGLLIAQGLFKLLIVPPLTIAQAIRERMEPESPEPDPPPPPPPPPTREVMEVRIEGHYQKQLERNARRYKGRQLEAMNEKAEAEYLSLLDKLER